MGRRQRFPNPNGTTIASLHPGEEIIVRAGFGIPPANKDTKEVIFDVSGMSAVTNTGRILTCDDGEGVKSTGKQLTSDQYSLSPEALRLQEQARQYNSGR